MAASSFWLPKPSALKTSWIPLFLACDPSENLPSLSSKYVWDPINPPYFHCHHPDPSPIPLLVSWTPPCALQSVFHTVIAVGSKIGSKGCDQLAERQHQSPSFNPVWVHSAQGEIAPVAWTQQGAPSGQLWGLSRVFWLEQRICPCPLLSAWRALQLSPLPRPPRELRVRPSYGPLGWQMTQIQSNHPYLLDRCLFVMSGKPERSWLSLLSHWP